MSESESKPETKPVKKLVIFAALIELCESQEIVTLDDFCSRLQRLNVEMTPINLRSFISREGLGESISVKQEKIKFTLPSDQLRQILLDGKFGDYTRAENTKIAAHGRQKHIPREPRD